jgi:hypothetical protein
MLNNPAVSWRSVLCPIIATLTVATELWSIICEFIERGIIRIEKIPRRLQLADLGTGARPYPDFIQLSRSIYGDDFSPEVQP